MLAVGCRTLPAVAMPVVIEEPHSWDLGVVEEKDQLSKPNIGSVIIHTKPRF